jgi:hypothetical protein
MAPIAKKTGAKKGPKVTKKFIINASQPASDKIFDVSAFEKFLNEKIKVEGRVGNLGETIKISQQGEGKIEIIAHNELSGRYLKYLYVLAISAADPISRVLTSVAGPRSSSRRCSSVTGSASSPPPRVSTSSSSSTSSTTRPRMTRSNLFGLLRDHWHE